MATEEKKTSPNLIGWDLTIHGPKDPMAVCKLLHQLAKQWMWQLERGIGGYVHGQGRIFLRQRCREGKLGNDMAAIGLDAHASPTTTGVHLGKNFSYVMKADTRIDGPWSDKDFNFLTDLIDKPTQQLTEVDQIKDTPYPWQTEILEMIKVPDRDKIHIIVDPAGMAGKSTLIKAGVADGTWLPIICYDSMEKLCGFICSMPRAKNYVIDIPRAIAHKKDWKKRKELWGAIEQIKTGLIMDWRYTSKIKLMERPGITVFMNEMPPPDCLTTKRADIWLIGSDGHLRKPGWTKTSIAPAVPVAQPEEKDEIDEKDMEELDRIFKLA